MKGTGRVSLCCWLSVFFSLSFLSLLFAVLSDVPVRFPTRYSISYAGETTNVNAIKNGAHYYYLFSRILFVNICIYNFIILLYSVYAQ